MTTYLQGGQTADAALLKTLYTALDDYFSEFSVTDLTYTSDVDREGLVYDKDCSFTISSPRYASYTLTLSARTRYRDGDIVTEFFVEFGNSAYSYPGTPDTADGYVFSRVNGEAVADVLVFSEVSGERACLNIGIVAQGGKVFPITLLEFGDPASSSLKFAALIAGGRELEFKDSSNFLSTALTEIPKLQSQAAYQVGSALNSEPPAGDRFALYGLGVAIRGNYIDFPLDSWVLMSGESSVLEDDKMVTDVDTAGGTCDFFIVPLYPSQYDGVNEYALNKLLIRLT